MINRACPGVAIGCVLAVVIASCGRGGPPLAKVRGLVTIGGKPLSTGSVEFAPDGTRGTSGRMALGRIQADGSFTLTTFHHGDGALVGFHTVAIVAVDHVPAVAGNPDSFKNEVSLVPKRYCDRKTSGLAVEVKTGIRNEFTFELTE